MITAITDPSGELAKPIGVDPAHRQAGCQQSADDAALVTAARFQADRDGRIAAHSRDQLGPTCRVVGDAKALPTWPDRHIQTVQRNVDPDTVRFAHLLTPSLLMRARAPATVRVWKTRLEHQAHSRFDSRGAHGLPAMTEAGS